MAQLYQENGRDLFASGNDLDMRVAPRARRGRVRWKDAAAPVLDPYHTPGMLGEPKDVSYQALLRSGAVNVRRLWVFYRLLRLMFYAAYFWAGVLLRRLNKMTVEERRKVNAKRFREVLLTLSGVMIKVGQQLSQRPDVLPPVYCDELRTLLDDLPETIPIADVIIAIERQTGKTLTEVFAEFDPCPVGSASVACVYRAVLHTGEEVAVKVRRPGIQKTFTADLNAINWLFFSLEFLTVWRPGTTRHIAVELRDVLLEELDFRREARHQELFRRYHKRRKKLNVTAPKVYYELSGEEVMVSEFVRGHKVQAIIEAMESGDEEYLESLRRSGISPKTVAQHLIRSRYYSFHECPLFHGDPHPSNILIQDNNRVVMMDFGACGVFSQRERNLMWQMNHYYSRDDVGGMVNMVLLLMEPIHPINIHPFRRELLDAWWVGFYGIKSNHAQWWERSSLRLWLRFFELIRKYQIPIPRNMVRMIRATLLYDTVAARLYRKINVFKEFEKYAEGVARRAKRRIVESAVRQLLLGPDDANFLKLQQVEDVGDDILVRVRRFLDNQDFTFARLAGKVYQAIRDFVRMILLALAAGGLAAALAGLLYVTRVLRPESWNPLRTGALQVILIFWLVVVVGLLITYGRRVYLRFGDVDD